jgi:hypothetical protein
MSEHPSQFEQENDLGRGGGEVDDETLRKGWETRRDRGRGPDTADETDYEDPAEERASEKRG